jgi:hypothetical protein
MLRSWWWCCVASTGPGLGRHSHSLALLGLTPGVRASWFGAAPAEILSPLVLAFRPRGVPGPTSKLSPRAPAQMGRRETKHEGGKPEGGRRKGETCGLRVVLRLGRVRLQ